SLKQNPTPRKLEVPHPASIPHANGRFWCLTCHTEKDIDHLHTLAGEPVDFNDSYLVCGQCHPARQKDWYFGAHGKRADNWQGPRQIYNCTHCHNPHDPLIPPHEPQKPPPVRAGLKPMFAAPPRAAPAAAAAPAEAAPASVQETKP
ncbi:MAG: cytochrome C, partial [Proteobacteria bacterium]|nr:cytochrome C [Pseudomonadota bacterium]